MIANAKMMAVSDFVSDFICIPYNKGRITCTGIWAVFTVSNDIVARELQITSICSPYHHLNGFMIKLLAVDDKLAAIAE